MGHWDTIHLPNSRFPTGEVDQLGFALRTGFNIGIYKSYETHLLVVNARTGAVVTHVVSHEY